MEDINRRLSPESSDSHEPPKTDFDRLSRPGKFFMGLMMFMMMLTLILPVLTVWLSLWLCSLCYKVYLWSMKRLGKEVKPDPPSTSDSGDIDRLWSDPLR